MIKSITIAILKPGKKPELPESYHPIVSLSLMYKLLENSSTIQGTYFETEEKILSEVVLVHEQICKSAVAIFHLNNQMDFRKLNVVLDGKKALFTLPLNQQ